MHRRISRHKQVLIMGQIKCYAMSKNAKEAGKCGVGIATLS